jgi:hypothetical protein
VTPCKSEFQKNTKGDVGSALISRRGRGLFGFKCVAQRFEKFRRCTSFIFYKFKIEIVTALLMFIFLIKETKDGQVRRIVVIIFSNAYAT